MDDSGVIMCNNTYTPTSEQYLEALGPFASTILIIGGLVTLGLFILFFEQAVYTNQTAHSACKRHIYWISSVFPMMTLMSLVALIEPRAHNVCLSVKMVYMSIGISHFTDLTMVLFGGEEQLLELGEEDTFNLQHTPFCCCCKCLPFPPVTKYSLRLVVLLTDQLPFLQAVYYVIVMILLSADNITLGDVNPAGAFLWLNLVKFTSVVLGVYGFMILSTFSRGYLDDFQYRKKSLSIRLLVLVTNLQLLAFNIMGNYNAFPCIPPFVPPNVYKQTVDNCLYILEMMILGPYTYWQYHDLRFSSPLSPLAAHGSRSSSVTHSSKRSITSRGSTISTIISENSIGSSSDLGDEASSESNGKGNGGGGANDMENLGNGNLNVDCCEKGDLILTSQPTSTRDMLLTSSERGNSNGHRVASIGGCLSPSYDGVKDSKHGGASILRGNSTCDKGNSCSERVTSPRNRFSASADSKKEEESRTSNNRVYDYNTETAESNEDGKKKSMREDELSTVNLSNSDDRASGIKRSKKSTSRSSSRDGSSSRASRSGKKKDESESRRGKTDKPSSKQKSRKITNTFYNLNEVSDSVASKYKESMEGKDVTSFTTAGKRKGGYESDLSNPTRKTINNMSIFPGMLNRAISVSQPNLKDRNEYERLY